MQINIFYLFFFLFIWAMNFHLFQNFQYFFQVQNIIFPHLQFRFQMFKKKSKFTISFSKFQVFYFYNLQICFRVSIFVSNLYLFFIHLNLIPNWPHHFFHTYSNLWKTVPAEHEPQLFISPWSIFKWLALLLNQRRRHPYLGSKSKSLQVQPGLTLNAFCSKSPETLLKMYVEA